MTKELMVAKVHDEHGLLLSSHETLFDLHFVFVHGFGGGGWVFYKMRCLLEKSGHKVSCPDLKSGGIDPTDPKTVITFEDYNQPLIDLLSSLPQNEKVILVGHSAGGLSLTHAIHKFPEKIHVAVFVAATMLRSGFLTDQDFKDGIPDPYSDGPGSGDDGHTEPSDPDDRQARLMHLCPPEDITLYAMLQKEGAYKAITGARFTEGTGVDNVPRVYIRSVHDRVVKPKQQESMLKRWAPNKVYAVESDHFPILSKPLDVFGILMRIATALQCDSSEAACRFNL